MNHRLSLTSLALGAFIGALGAAPAGVLAQQAVTVSGHVTAAGAPLQGAHVRVDELKPEIDRVTDEEGHYSFIIPSLNVRGQTITITASMSDRRVKYASSSVKLRLTGGPVTEDFDLKITSGERPATPPPGEQSASQPGAPPGPTVTSAPNDTVDLVDVAGSVDLLSALAGRFPGLSITEPGVLGGSSVATYRGPRSAFTTSEPLVVVDGIPVQNTVFTTGAQRFGLGGFDYGSPLQDLDLSTVSTVRLLSGPDASARYGGRAANGVLVVTTKNGVNGPGFSITAHEQITSESPGRMPDFQNQFGQGLDGKFQFFDGKGGGINDGVAENWGPALDNRPLAQASLTQAGQAEVRLWSPHPSNIRDYFDNGRTTNTIAGIQGSASFGSFHASVGNRDTHGLEPDNTLQRRSGAFNGTLSPYEGLTIGAWISGAQTNDDGSPGTGFDVGNPVAEFTRLGRQVDATALRSHLLDSTGHQISWNYAGQNNPYFAALENSNKSDENHTTGGASVAMTLSPWLDLHAQAGTDYVNDTRNFFIHDGWMGGFPFFAAAGGGDFSKGGFESDGVYSQETSSAVRLDEHRTLSNGVLWTVSAGGDALSTRQRIKSIGVDSAVDVPIVGAPDTATAPSPANWAGHGRTNGVFGESGLVFANGATARLALRDEWTSIGPGQHASTLYPSASGSVDLFRAFASLRNQSFLSGATLRAAWANSGSDLTPFALQTMFSGRTPSGALTPNTTGALTVDPGLAPEVTSAIQGGADLSFWHQRLGVGFTIYHEQTSNVILPVTDSVLQTVQARNAGKITNNGIEGDASLRVLDGDWLGWDISGNAAKNSNSVGELFGRSTAIDISPVLWGLHVEARTGSGVGVLVGENFLRDPSSHALILRNGLPLPDTVHGPTVLGNAQPDWVVGLRNSFRLGFLKIDVLTDGHFGGSIFSATNYWGSYSGSLASTSFRPDSGLLIAGIDAATGTANTQHVSTQDYYHALGAIQEPWVYSASYFKVREIRAKVMIPTPRGLPFSALSASLIARNVYLWAKAPNIDPETALSQYQFGGLELGQLPSTKSVGIQLSLVP